MTVQPGKTPISSKPGTMEGSQAGSLCHGQSFVLNNQCVLHATRLRSAARADLADDERSPEGALAKANKKR